MRLARLVRREVVTGYDDGGDGGASLAQLRFLSLVTTHRGFERGEVAAQRGGGSLGGEAIGVGERALLLLEGPERGLGPICHLGCGRLLRNNFV